MLLQFQVVSDNSLWIVDTQYLQWGRVSAPPNPAQPEESKVLESGKLAPLGFGRYGLEGRTPKTQGPGAGLSCIGVNTIGVGNTILVEIRPNVDIKDFTMPVPIRQVLYRILPTDPKMIQDYYEEIFNAQGSEGKEPPRQEEPKIAGSLPETTAGEEQSATKTSVGPTDTELVAGINPEGRVTGV